jgi:hypothetical protein
VGAPAGDPRFGDGATPPPVRERGRRSWILFWGLFIVAVGAGYGVLDLMSHYDPDPIPWNEVGLASFTPLAVMIAGAGALLSLVGLAMVVLGRD